MIELRFKKLMWKVGERYELVGFKMLKTSKLPSEYLEGTPRMEKQNSWTIIFAGDDIELEKFALHSGGNWWIRTGHFFTFQQVEAILAFTEKAGDRLRKINDQIRDQARKDASVRNGVEKFYV